MKVIEYLKNKTLNDLKLEYGINFKNYGDLIVFNYDQIDSPKKDDITIECRSLVLDSDYNIVSRSFDRFFNLGECDHHNNIELKNFKSLEKCDGSLINIYFHKGKWLIRTRGTAFAESEIYDFENNTFTKSTYKNLVLRTLRYSEEEFQKFANDTFNTELTYIFEFIGPSNLNIVRYMVDELVLLAVRNNNTGEYISHENAISLVNKINNKNIRYCKYYDHKNISDLIEHSKSLPNYQEGFVIWNTITHERIKVKNPAYVQVHHLKDNGGVVNPNRVAGLVWINEFSEILSYFPEYTKYFTPFIEKYELLKSSMVDLWNKSKYIESQKEFAENIKHHRFSAFMFSARKYGTDPLDEMRKVEACNAHKWLS